MHTSGSKFYEQIEHLFNITKKHETAPSWAMGLKLSEECGEMCEVLMYEHGFLAHKNKEFESLFGEADDIINVLTGILAQHYPDMSSHELTEKLYDAVCEKGEKYERIIKP